MRQVRASRFLSFQQITMPYLAALTPPAWQVSHVDEECEPVDPNAVADLVGITFHTPSASHAYDLAGRFRARGIPVALGGPHATLLPEEASQHADAVFVGEAETTWPQYLQDLTPATRREYTGQTPFPAWRGCRRRARTCFTGAIIRAGYCLDRAAARMPAISAPWR